MGRDRNQPPTLRRLTDHFVDKAAACASLGSLRNLLGDASRELGFTYFALLHHVSLEEPRRDYARLDNYPEGWAEELVRMGAGLNDPVHLASRRTNAGFRWVELDRLMVMDRVHRRILLRSRRFGIGDGFTVPVNVPGEPSGSCSFAVSTHGSLPKTRLQCAELIGAHAFRAARRLLSLPERRSRPHLSRRELECLQLVARGKSDSEIATVLAISTETARQYVKRARAAYDVVSRTQLVVHGLRDEWLRFEDALAPTSPSAE